MIEKSRIRPAAALLATALTLTACHLEANTPELKYTLNDTALAANPDLEGNAADIERLRGGLEFLFGTPSAPSYLVLEDWVDEEFDPNDWGYFGLDDEQWDALVASNRQAFAAQIAAIEAGDFEALAAPRYAEDLWADWLDYLDTLPQDPDALLDPDDPDLGSWRDEALAIWEGYYPSLRTSSEMYRVQCYHCHGASGGGDGSTAEFLEPRPRDYRPGIFKGTALRDKSRPRSEDLFHTLEDGIYTTAMPSFRRFSDAQLHGLVDYVRLLSIRGETEILLIDEYDPDEGIGLGAVEENYTLVVDRWRSAEEKMIAYEGEVPESTPERIAHGRELFLDEKGANCIKCHGAQGRGDGPSTWERNPDTGELELVKDDWGNPIQPRNLTDGVFRFGRRPIDLFRRMYAGINGTPMPEHIGMQITEPDGNQRPLAEDDLWDIVFFVRMLSSHPMSATPAVAESLDH